MPSSLTIIIPAFNDAEGLAATLPSIIKTCAAHDWKCIVVNDASTDNTASILEKYSDDLCILTNEENLGYGGSIKRGIIAADTQWVATMDADGQHRVEDLESLAEQKADYDAVLGMRGSDSHAPAIRRPGKWILKKTANLLTGKTIPDINCGLRILKRNVMLSILNLTSNRFSFSTSTAVALIQMGMRVKFAPVIVEERIGNSTVKQVRDGLYTILLLLRLITLFNPMRVLLPLGAGLFGLGAVYQIVSFITFGPNINDTTSLLCISGLIIFVLALMTDQISALRRDLIVQKMRSEASSCRDED